MNSSTPERSRIDRRVRAEAAAWLARLHGPDRAHALETGFRRWHAEHPSHAAEFELATDAWNQTAGVSLHGRHRPSAGPRAARHNRFVRRTTAGLAACLLMAIWIDHTLGRSIVTTSVGEQRTIWLADGSRVTLNTDSRIVVQYDQYSRTVILRYGEAYFQVVHNQARPFVVRAGDRKIIDVGTSFVVSRNQVGAGSLSITVIEGRVAVASLEVAEFLPKVGPLEVLFVSAGNSLLLRPHAPPSIKAEAVEQATAWLRGQLVFYDATLGIAVAQFNRYNSVKIIVGASQLDKIRVGGVFRTGASESFARSVADASHLRLVVQGDALVLEPGGGTSNAE